MRLNSIDPEKISVEALKFILNHTEKYIDACRNSFYNIQRKALSILITMIFIVLITIVGIYFCFKSYNIHEAVALWFCLWPMIVGVYFCFKILRRQETRCAGNIPNNLLIKSLMADDEIDQLKKYKELLLS